MDNLTTEQKCLILYGLFKDRRDLVIDKGCREYYVPEYVSIDFTTQDNKQVRLTTVHFSDDGGFLLPDECVPGTEITDDEYGRIVDALLSSVLDNSYIRGMDNNKTAPTRFRDLKRTTKINIGVAVLVVALLSGLFFLINENTRLRRALDRTRIEQRTFPEQPAVIAPADTTAAE